MVRTVTQGYKLKSNASNERGRFFLPSSLKTSSAWYWKAVTGAEDWQMLFILTQQRDTEFRPASTHKHDSLDGKKKISPAVVSSGLHSVTSPYWWGPPSSRLTKTTKACLHLRLPAYPPAPPLHNPYQGLEFTCQAMNSHRQQQELEESSRNNGNTHQSLPETFPHLPPAQKQHFFEGNNIATLRTCTGEVSYSWSHISNTWEDLTLSSLLKTET